ncbi:YfjI family protein [Stutzerimonas stutzeri]|uniref:YfjI family protein n=1 Tax=Stutzerimonas sp. S1 TaxID=3030652 RepID=UPI002224B7D8|nr:YfjI family protein [Stutzerimonas sp. S1]MCW3149289.1 YfjI family protein [Stutzerimonas sp. S1]
MNESLMTKPTYPEPLRLLPDLEAAAPFPLHALGELLGGAAAAIVEAVQVPEALAAQSILAASAMAAQPHGNALRDGQPIPLSLFALTIAESGDRKSPADRLALRSHHGHQKALLEAYVEKQRRYRDQRDAYQRARTGILESGNSDPEVVATELGRLQEPEAPALPFILAEEPTLEGLQKSLLRGHSSQGFFSDEGGQFFGGHASRPENLLKSVAGLSKLWDGAPIIRTRSAEGESASRIGCRLSAHLMIQPIVAEGVLGNPIMRGQGFLARFLIAWPQSLAGTRFYRNSDPNLDVRLVSYWERMTQLLQLEPRVNDRGDLDPPTLMMDTPAKAVWIEAHDAIEAGLGRGGDLQEIKATAAKSGEHILRIAGVLAIVENTSVLTRPIVERAAVLVRWYLAEALRLTSPVAVEPHLLLAQQLLDWFIERGWSTFDARTLQRDGPRFARKSARQRDLLLATLTLHRQVLTSDGKHYRVNPLATSGNAAFVSTEMSPGVANVSPASTST